MAPNFRNPLLSFLFFSLLLVSCLSNQDQPVRTEPLAQGQKDTAQNQQHPEIVEFVEKLLFAAGNKNVDAMKELIFDDALVGNTVFKDSFWVNKQWAVEDIYKIYQDSNATPYLEIVDDYEIIVTDRMALVKADAGIQSFGIPGKREINHMILIKADDDWKLFSIAWSVHQPPQEKMKFDIDLFARHYAQVWGSTRPDFVAMFYEEDGALQINDATPARGRTAISEVARSFMSRFPDMKVSYDRLIHNPDGIEFHWTFTGTDAHPDGRGHKVKVSGYELWTMSEENLIKNSKGSFPTEEYNRQLKYGIGN